MTSPEEVLKKARMAIEDLCGLGDQKEYRLLNSVVGTLQSILAIVPIRELTPGRLETDFSSGHREGHNSLLSEVRALIEKGVQ